MNTKSINQIALTKLREQRITRKEAFKIARRLKKISYPDVMRMFK
jgi:hypothetical protein